MAQDLQRLETALRTAAAEGDTTAATRIAEAVRNRRAMGDQETPAAVPLTEAEPDPFATVPTDIGGVTLSDDIRQQILDGRAIEDPKEQRLAAARIAGRVAAMDKSGAFSSELVRGGNAALRGFGAGIFGLGDVAAAAGTAARGIGDENALSFGEALEAQRAFRRGLEEDFPVVSGVGEVGGALVGGGAAFKAISKAPAAVQKIAALQKGQKLANVARISAGGAAAGGITEGVTEGEAQKGAFLGVAAGPLGVGLTKAGQLTKAGITKALEDPAAAGIKAMAKKIGVSADDMMQRFMEFKTVTGKNPTMADLANNEAAAELRGMIGEHASASAIAREAAEAATSVRPGEIAEQLTGGGVTAARQTPSARVTTTRGAQEVRRTAVAEEAFAKAEQDPIKFTRGQVADLLNDPNLRDGLPRTLKRRLDEAMDAAGDGPLTLTGLDVNDMRKALRKRGRGATGADQVFNELATEVEDIARKQSKAFGQAIDEFAARSLRGEGVEAGRKVITAKASEFAQTAGAATDPNLAAGLRVGARSEIVDVAREGATQAQGLVKKLSTDSGLTKRLREVLPAREVDRIQEVARLQARAGENVRTLAPGVRARGQDELAGIVDDAVGGIIAATGGAGAGFKSNVALRILRRILPGGSPKVAENIARDLFDPSKTQKVITALRRAEVNEEAILDLYTKVAVGSGAGAAAVVE